MQVARLGQKTIPQLRNLAENDRAVISGFQGGLPTQVGVGLFGRWVEGTAVQH